MTTESKYMNHPSGGGCGCTTTTIQSPFPLYHDVLLPIFELYRDDYGTLYRFSLVNKEFNRTASKLLYARVVLSPPPSLLRTLNLRDQGSIVSPTNLSTGTSPRYSSLVTELEISGSLSPRAPPRSIDHTIISDAISKFPNLTSIKFTPRVCHSEVFIDSLKLFPGLSHLQELKVNSSCTDEDGKVQLLTQITGLRKLVLYDPGRAILQVLPDWLGKLSRTLTSLHLLDNCGSVTPGVLKSFIPHLHEQIKEFSLGLSYSLTNTDVFEFINQLSALERLQLRRYYQIKTPAIKPRLPKLKGFTATQRPVHSEAYARDAGAWVRRIVSGSPLEILHIVTEGDDNEDEENPEPARPAYDGLVDHLIYKQSTTLRYLYMKNCLVSLNLLPALLEACKWLDSFHIAVDKSGLALFEEIVASVQNLRSAAFEVHNVRRTQRSRPWKFTIEDAERVMKKGSQLRRLSVNGLTWESSWKYNKGEDLSELVISEVSPIVAPWNSKK